MATSLYRNLELILSNDSEDGQSFETLLRDRDSGATLGRAQSACDFWALQDEFIEPLRNHAERPLAEGFLPTLGRRLATILLPGDLQPKFLEAVHDVSSNGEAVRVHLNCSSRLLDEIPWEYIYFESGPGIPARGAFLCRMRHVHLIRSVGAKPVPDRAPVNERLTVLFAYADPSTPEHPALPTIREELNSIRAALGSGVCWNVDLQLAEWTTRSKLKQALREFRPHVLYFSGHGEKLDEGALILHREGSQDPEISGSELADLLTGLPTRLVVLCACDSAAVARTLAERGVPAVIAMQIPLRAAIGEAFARNLYSLLAQPKPVDEALSMTRRYLEPESIPDWGAAVLYLNGDGEIFDRVPHKAPFETKAASIHFKGRGELIEEIHRRLMPPIPELKPPIPVALVGMGGLGKSETCLQYAQRYRSAYEGGVFWIDARDADRTIQRFAEIGRLYFDVAEKDSLALQAAQTRRKLQEHQRPYLLIYDGVNRADDISVLPNSYHCHILFTTRQPHAVEHLAHIVNMPLLEPEACMELLQLYSQARTDLELQAVKDIAEALGSHPLALSLAASYIRQRQQSFAEYAYQAARWEGLDPVYESLEISYRDLPTDAACVLRVAALFAPHAISPSLLFEACRRVNARLSRDLFNKAVLKLTAYSLIGREHRADDEPEARLSLHQLIRDFAQRKQTAPRRNLAIQRIGEVLTPLLEAANAKESWSRIRPEIPHCHSLAQLYRDGDADRGAIPMLRQLGHYCHQHGELRLASRLFAEGLKQAEGRPPKAGVDAAFFRMKLGQIEQDLDRPTQALEYERQALDMAAALLEPDDPRLADFYNCFGYVLKKQGQFDAALSYYRKACALYENAYGRAHAELTSCYNNMGTTYESMRRFDLAVEYIEKALAIDEALYAAERAGDDPAAPRLGSPKIAIRLNNLGRVLGDNGDWTRALPIHERALAINESTFERRHPDVAASLYYTGRALAGVGRPAEAKSLLEESLAIYKHFFGPDHFRCGIVRKVIESIDVVPKSDETD